LGAVLWVLSFKGQLGEDLQKKFIFKSQLLGYFIAEYDFEHWSVLGGKEKKKKKEEKKKK